MENHILFTYKIYSFTVHYTTENLTEQIKEKSQNWKFACKLLKLLGS